MNRLLIVANWKMQTTLAEALVITNGIKTGVANLTAVDIVLCPPFPWLVSVAEVLHKHRLAHLSLGAQNIFWQERGAYTGEVAASMLTGLAKYVIIGHSERRRYGHETDQEIKAKLSLASQAKLTPILCIGEEKMPSAALLADPSDLTAKQLARPLAELEEALHGADRQLFEQLVVAYEPVWAISGHGQAQAATGFYANAVIEQIRHKLVALAGPSGKSIPILYGGSVTEQNAGEFLHQPEINGLLVGGASLKVKSFVGICQTAASIR